MSRTIRLLAATALLTVPVGAGAAWATPLDDPNAPEAPGHQVNIPVGPPLLGEASVTYPETQELQAPAGPALNAPNAPQQGDTYRAAQPQPQPIPAQAAAPAQPVAKPVPAQPVMQPVPAKPAQPAPAQPAQPAPAKPAAKPAQPAPAKPAAKPAPAQAAVAQPAAQPARPEVKAAQSRQAEVKSNTQLVEKIKPAAQVATENQAHALASTGVQISLAIGAGSLCLGLGMLVMLWARRREA